MEAMEPDTDGESEDAGEWTTIVKPNMKKQRQRLRADLENAKKGLAEVMK